MARLRCFGWTTMAATTLMFSFCSPGVKPRLLAGSKFSTPGERDGRRGLPRRARLGSRDDVRRDLVFDEGDAVAQLQLALLEALQPQQIRRRRLMQRFDRGIEIAVLLLEPCELGGKLAFVCVGHDSR